MQLDVEVSPPAFGWFFIRPCTPYNSLLRLLPGDLDLQADLGPLILTHVIFDLNQCGPWPPILPVSLSNEAASHVFWPGDLDLLPTTLTFRVDLEVIQVHVLTKFLSPRCNGSWDMNFVLVTDIQTYRKRCIWAHCAYAQVGSKRSPFRNDLHVSTHSSCCFVRVVHFFCEHLSRCWINSLTNSSRFKIRIRHLGNKDSPLIITHWLYTLRFRETPKNGSPISIITSAFGVHFLIIWFGLLPARHHYLIRAVTSPTSDPGNKVLSPVACRLPCLWVVRVVRVVQTSSSMNWSHI